jgi:hypothetical protein|tara:strand:- start:44 stop:199 length:156 start_codon:yes stop_codon:yes gene_type:complete
MKTFRIENKHTYEIIKVTLYQPPYEDENILNKTGWNSKDVTITDITIMEDK